MAAQSQKIILMKVLSTSRKFYHEKWRHVLRIHSTPESTPSTNLAKRLTIFSTKLRYTLRHKGNSRSLSTSRGIEDGGQSWHRAVEEEGAGRPAGRRREEEGSRVKELGPDERQGWRNGFGGRGQVCHNETGTGPRPWSSDPGSSLVLPFRHSQPGQGHCSQFRGKLKSRLLLPVIYSVDFFFSKLIYLGFNMVIKRSISRQLLPPRRY